MFDLNKAISSWRMGLSERQTCAKSDIDELETHLREEIDSLTASKLSQQEAFLVATHRLGDPDSLAAEFAKVNTSILWRNRSFWIGAIVLGWLVLTYIGETGSRTCVFLASLVGMRGYTLNIVDTLSQMTFFWTAVFILYIIFYKKKDARGDLFYKMADNFWGKVALFAGIFLIVAAMLAAETFIPAKTVQLLNANEFGKMLLLRKYKELIWIISTPLALLIGTILVRPSKLREARV